MAPVERPPSQPAGAQAVSFSEPQAVPHGSTRSRPIPEPRPKVVTMKIGVAKETAPGERRVALVPEALGKLKAAGLEILVEQGAGAGSAIPDSAYADAGATVV